MTKLAIIGECMIELSGKPFSDHISQGFGGDTLNTALYLKYLHPSSHVQYITALGADPISEQMLRAWEMFGIDTQYVTQFSHLSPGLYWIHLNDNGERTFSYWRKGSAASQWLKHENASQVLEHLMQVDWIYLSGISFAILDGEDRRRLLDFLTAYQAAGGRIAFDSNYRPHLWQSVEEARAFHQAILAIAEVALLTDEDEAAIWQISKAEVPARLAQLHCPTIILKQGALGATIISADSHCLIPAERVFKVVDTTAAGDSFNAGFLSTLLQQGSLEEACAMGHKVAATVIQYQGAIMPRPLFDQIIEEYL